MSQKIYQLVTDRILALLQQGVVPWKKPWTTNGHAAAPVNLLSGRPYSRSFTSSRLMPTSA